MSKISCILFLGLAMFSLSAMSETYKCRSTDGKISYAGQMPLTPGVKCEQIFVKKQAVVVQDTQPTEAEGSGDMDPESAPPPASGSEPMPTPVKKTDPKNSKPELEAAKKKSEQAPQDKSGTDKQAEQKIKEENCQAAKTNLRTYQAGGRISKVNEIGEKVYLDDSEVKQKIQDAQKDVDKWCGS